MGTGRSEMPSAPIGKRACRCAAFTKAPAAAAPPPPPPKGAVLSPSPPGTMPPPPPQQLCLTPDCSPPTADGYYLSNVYQGCYSTHRAAVASENECLVAAAALGIRSKDTNEPFTHLSVVWGHPSTRAVLSRRRPSSILGMRRRQQRRSYGSIPTMATSRRRKARRHRRDTPKEGHLNSPLITAASSGSATRPRSWRRHQAQHPRPRRSAWRIPVMSAGGTT